MMSHHEISLFFSFVFKNLKLLIDAAGLWCKGVKITNKIAVGVDHRNKELNFSNFNSNKYALW